MMEETASIAADIHDYLRQSAHVNDSSFEIDTDLIETDQLDSLVVMDLVCFVESRFGVRMDPQDVNPRNLQSVGRLARYVHTQLHRKAA
jgi:acyl carrier protein